MSLPYLPYSSENEENTSITSTAENIAQFRQYHLLEELQNRVHKLPMNMQQRLSYSLLSDIAAALLDEAIFTIVGDLKEIQDLTEKTLHSQRQKILLNHKDVLQKLYAKQKAEIQTCRPHNLVLLKNEHKNQKEDLEKRLQVELIQVDKKVLKELDEKVSDQQATLQSAGMPGFYVTSDPKEIKLQMTILQLVLDLNHN